MSTSYQAMPDNYKPYKTTEYGLGYCVVGPEGRISEVGMNRYNHLTDIYMDSGTGGTPLTPDELEEYETLRTILARLPHTPS